MYRAPESEEAIMEQLAALRRGQDEAIMEQLAALRRGQEELEKKIQELQHQQTERFIQATTGQNAPRLVGNQPTGPVPETIVDVDFQGTMSVYPKESETMDGISNSSTVKLFTGERTSIEELIHEVPEAPTTYADIASSDQVISIVKKHWTKHLETWDLRDTLKKKNKLFTSVWLSACTSTRVPRPYKIVGLNELALKYQNEVIGFTMPLEDRKTLTGNAKLLTLGD